MITEAPQEMRSCVGALPRTPHPVPCGRRALSATERRKPFAQRLASHCARQSLGEGEDTRRDDVFGNLS